MMSVRALFVGGVPFFVFATDSVVAEAPPSFERGQSLPFAGGEASALDAAISKGGSRTGRCVQGIGSTFVAVERQQLR